MSSVTEQINPTSIPTTTTGEANVSPAEGEAAANAESKQHKGPPKKLEYPGLEYIGEGDDKKAKKLKAIPGLVSKENPGGFNPSDHKLLVAKNFTESYLVEHHKASVHRWRADECDKEAEAIKKGGSGQRGQKAITNALATIKEIKGDMSTEDFKANFPDIADLLGKLA